MCLLPVSFVTLLFFASPTFLTVTYHRLNETQGTAQLRNVINRLLVLDVRGILSSVRVSQRKRVQINFYLPSPSFSVER